MKAKRIIAVLVTIVMIFTLVGCNSEDDSKVEGASSAGENTDNTETEETIESAESKGNILIGMTTPLTGDFASGGFRASQGAELAVKEINEAGGVLGGYMLELQIEDDQGNSDISVNMVNKLASDGAAVLMGPYFSGGTLAVADALRENEIATINGSTAATVRELNNSWIFRARATDDINVAILAKAVEDGGATKVGLLCVNDEVGMAAADLYIKNFKEAGLEYYYEGHNPTDVDMSTTLNKSIEEGCDAYIIVTHNNTVSVLARQMYELGIDAPVYSNPIIAQSEVLDLMEPEWVEGWRCVADFAYTDTRPHAAEFTKAFVEEYDDNPEIMAALYYGFVYIIADSIERAGSYNSIDIRDAMAQTENLQVPVGKVFATNDEYTNMIFEISIARIEELKPIIEGSISLIE